jgi:hypothetical protein
MNGIREKKVNKDHSISFVLDKYVVDKRGGEYYVAPIYLDDHIGVVTWRAFGLVAGGTIFRLDRRTIRCIKKVRVFDNSWEL